MKQKMGGGCLFNFFPPAGAESPLIVQYFCQIFIPLRPHHNPISSCPGTSSFTLNVSHMVLLLGAPYSPAHSLTPNGFQHCSPNQFVWCLVFVVCQLSRDFRYVLYNGEQLLLKNNQASIIKNVRVKACVLFFSQHLNWNQAFCSYYILYTMGLRLGSGVWFRVCCLQLYIVTYLL